MLLDLTPDEREWIEQHPVIHAAISIGDQLPAESWVAGRAEGIGVDYARLMASRIGMQLEFDPVMGEPNASHGTEASLAAYDLYVGMRKVDGTPDNFDYLTPFTEGKFMLVARKGDLQIRTQNDLAHARVVVARGFPWLDSALTSRYPGATLLFANDERSAIDMVISGEADAFIGVTEARTKLLLSERENNDASMLSALDLPPVRIALATPRNRTKLFGLLKKADASITPDERVRLRSRWEGHAVAGHGVFGAADLSEQEKTWLAQLRPLRLGYETDRYPYSFTNKQGQFDGIAADYVHILETALGIRVEPMPARDWSELETMVKAKEVDMIAASMPEDFQSTDMVFTQPYERFPDVIVAPMQGSAVMRAEDLIGRTVTARDEARLISILRRLMPRSRIVPVASNEAGMEAVATGEADNYVGTLPAVDPLLRGRYAGELRIVGPAGMDQDLAFGVSSDYAALAPLIDRTLVNVKDSNRQSIRTHWLDVEYHYGVPLKQVMFGLLGGLCLFGLVSIAYIRLRRAVHAKQIAEHELTKQLAFQSAMLESIPYPVFVKDEHCRYLAVNKAYETLFACHREDLIGRDGLQSGHMRAMDAHAIHAADLTVLRTGQGVQREARLLLDNGSHVKDVLLWVHRLQSKESKAAGLLGTFVDVTDLREAESRARSLENQLNDIGATVPGAFFQIRCWSDGGRQFNYVAGDTASLTGMTPAQIIADEYQLFSRLHPEDQKDTVERLLTALADNQPIEAHDFRINVKGSWRWLRTAGGQPRQLADGSMQWTGYWVDTTNVHQQQQELIDAKLRAEEAMASKSAFFAMMSHEIRTPMVGVLGLIELLQKKTFSEEQAQTLGLVHESAGSLLHILDDVLDYSRVESGQLELEVGEVDLRSMADAILGLSMTTANDKGVRLYEKLDRRLVGSYWGDPVRIRQIASNLVSNAVKFTDNGSVDLRIEVLDETHYEHRIRISVVDTGIGISEAKIGRLFSPFAQAEVSTARRFGGTGLGLSICQRLAHLMGGEVGLESHEGKGTTAWLDITLRLVRVQPEERPYDGKTALLSVRSGLVRRDLSEHLSALGLRVFEAGAAGLDPLVAQPIDLYVIENGSDDTDVPPASRRIRLVDSFDQSGFDESEGAVVLHGNPLSWRTVVGACNAAFSKTPIQTAVEGIQPGQRSSARILVAEDHSVNRIVIAEQLSFLGYSHTVVGNGEEALQALNASSFDLLITDTQMPVVDGYELVRRIRCGERGGRGRLPIIAWSASASPEYTALALAAGVDELLAKPMSLSQLDRVVSKYAHLFSSTRGHA